MREPIEVKVEGRVYRLRQPSIADLSNYKRAVRRAGGRQVALGDKLLLLEAGLKNIGAASGREDPAIASALEVVADAKNRLIEFLNEMQAGAFEGVAPDEFVAATNEALTWSAELLHIASIVEAHYQPYADAMADAEVYADIAGRVALELFLEDTEGFAEPVKRSLGRVAAETIEAVPSSDLAMIHARFQEAVQVNEAEKKGSPSRTSGGGARSNSEATSTARQTARSMNGKRSTSPRSTSAPSPSIHNGRTSPATTN